MRTDIRKLEAGQPSHATFHMPHSIRHSTFDIPPSTDHFPHATCLMSHATFHMPHATSHFPDSTNIIHSTFHTVGPHGTQNGFQWNRAENMSRTVSDGKEAHSPQYMHSTCIACPAILVTFSTLIHGSNSVFRVGPRWKVEWTMWNLRKWDYCGIWNVACGMWHVACGIWNAACGM